MAMALMIVDMLNDFITPGGKLYFERGQSVVAPVVALRRAFSQNGLPVFYNNDAHSEDSEEFNLWPPHCIAGTHGAAVVDELTPKSDDFVFEKDTLGCFSNEMLEIKLRALGVNELYICGVATEYCVLQAVLGACKRGFSVTVVEDAIAGVDINPGDVDNALEAMRKSGVKFVTLEHVLDGLDA